MPLNFPLVHLYLDMLTFNISYPITIPLSVYICLADFDNVCDSQSGHTMGRGIEGQGGLPT